MKIRVIDLDGKESQLDSVSGWRLMEILKEHNIPIKAECGGCCACATCHVYIDPLWLERLPTKSDEEEDMLDTAFMVEANSRLSCQVIMTEELDGLTIHLPPYNQ